MSEIGMLLRLQLKNTFNSAFSKKKKQSFAVLLTLSVVLSLLMMTSFFFMYFEIGKQLGKSGLINFIFIQSGIVSVLAVVFLVTMQVSVGFFRAKDKELLSSLPIKQSSIISSKLLGVVLWSYYYAFITFFPSVIVYYIFSSFDVGLFFMIFGASLVLPLFPCAVGIVLGAFVSWLGSKIKSKFVVILLSILISVAVMLFSTFYQNIIAFYIEKGADFNQALEYALPSVGLFVSGISGVAWKYALLYVVSIVSIALATTFAIIINNKVDFSKTAKQKPKIVRFERRSLFGALFKKETKLYFGSPTYVVNTIICFVLILILPLIYRFSGLMEVLPQNLKTPTILLSLCAMICFAYISSVSISAEGKHFSNLVSLPIKPSTIVFCKASFHFVFGLGFSLVSSILFVTLISGLSKLAIASIILFPVLSLAISSLFGVLANLLFPKLKCTNDAQFVKQGFSGFLGILGSIVLCGIPFVVWFFATGISQNYMILITFCWFLLVILAIFLILLKKSQKLMSKIEV